MSKNKQLEFPGIVCFEEYGGDFNAYFSAVYELFKADFILSQPLYERLKVSVQKHPEVDGIHRTFYHITHEGNDEQCRMPDFRRMERIRFPKFVIENSKHPEILIWKNCRGRDTRVLLFNEIEDYLVVLTERKGYYLFWTAYLVTELHRKRKLLKEYETYQKTKTA